MNFLDITITKPVRSHGDGCPYTHSTGSALEMSGSATKADDFYASSGQGSVINFVLLVFAILNELCQNNWRKAERPSQTWRPRSVGAAVLASQQKYLLTMFWFSQAQVYDGG